MAVARFSSGRRKIRNGPIELNRAPIAGHGAATFIEQLGYDKKFKIQQGNIRVCLAIIEWVCFNAFLSPRNVDRQTYRHHVLLHILLLLLLLLVLILLLLLLLIIIIIIIICVVSHVFSVLFKNLFSWYDTFPGTNIARLFQ